MMNICVYGAANECIAPIYLAEGRELGKLMAQKGHRLVFGAGATGMMGAVAVGVHECGGTMLGVAPKFFDRPGVLYQACDEMVFTDTMRQRKQRMEEESDAFVMTPGGLGTMEEFFEIITLRQLARHDKPIIIFNIAGYYDPLIRLIEHAIEGGFIGQEGRDLYAVATTAREVVELLTQNDQ